MVAMPAKRGTSSPPNGWLKGLADGWPGGSDVFVMTGVAGNAAILGKGAMHEDRKTQHRGLDFVQARCSTPSRPAEWPATASESEFDGRRIPVADQRDDWCWGDAEGDSVFKAIAHGIVHKPWAEEILRRRHLGCHSQCLQRPRKNEGHRNAETTAQQPTCSHRVHITGG